MVTHCFKVYFHHHYFFCCFGFSFKTFKINFWLLISWQKRLFYKFSSLSLLSLYELIKYLWDFTQYGRGYYYEFPSYKFFRITFNTISMQQTTQNPLNTLEIVLLGLGKELADMKFVYVSSVLYINIFKL